MGEKREVFRMKDADVITYGKDKDGTPYSAENTPKRSDKTKSLWSLYRDGITVGEVLAQNGGKRSPIRRDRRAGNIVITPAPAEESEAQAA